MLVLPIFMTIENDEERSLAENLYLTYKSRMYGIAYAILHNREDAEDAVMDAVFSIVKNISLFSSIPRNKTESLIVVIIRNAAINIRSLDPIYRDILLLKYLYEYDNGTIAAMTGIAEATVRVRLMRAKEKLSELLRGGESDGAK